MEVDVYIDPEDGVVRLSLKGTVPLWSGHLEKIGTGFLQMVNLPSPERLEVLKAELGG